MGNAQARTPTPLFPPPVPGKTRICVMGWTLSPHTGKAALLARTLQSIYPDRYDTWFWFNKGSGDKDPYRGTGGALPTFQEQVLPPDHPLRKHRTSPFVWLEVPEPLEGKTYTSEQRPGVNFLPLGGRDRFSEWILENIAEEPQTSELRKAASTTFKVTDTWVDETPGTSQQA